MSLFEGEITEMFQPSGNALSDLIRLGASVSPCGSRITCNPPPKDSDFDYLVYVPRPVLPQAIQALKTGGYEWEGGQHYQDAANTFMSWRSHNINYIVTSDPDFHRRHDAATALSKRLNLMDKKDRIALFQAVLYGNVM